MDWNIRRRVCSARKGQKRVESLGQLGVRVSDLRSSVMRMDLGKARPYIWASYLVYKMGVLVTGANWQWDELTANRQFRINFRFKISRIVLQ